MKLKKLIIIISALTFCLMLFSNSIEEMAGQFQLIKENEYTTFYNIEFSQSVENKINPVNQKVLTYLEKTDNCYEYSNHNLTKEEKSLFLEYFELMPETLQEIFIKKVYAVYFIDGLNYGGKTELVYDEKMNTYCIIYFNAETFKKTLTEWIEYRDNSIFQGITDENKFKVDYSFEYRGILHTLIHETCHVYDYMNDITIFQNSGEKNQFTENWDDYTVPQKRYRNKKIMRADFYDQENKIKIKKGKNLIEYLKSTPFSSIYGAKNRADDFAETLTYYILFKKLHLDYKVNYIEQGILKESYSWSENKNIEKLYPLCALISGI